MNVQKKEKVEDSLELFDERWRGSNSSRFIWQDTRKKKQDDNEEEEVSSI